MTAPTLDEQHSKTPRELAADWLRKRVKTQAGAVPDIASSDWLRLPDNHPLKVAAVCRAALAWVHHTDPATIESDLLDELEAVAFVQRERLDADYALSVRRLVEGPTRVELDRRRAAPASAIGRPWTPQELGVA